MNSMVIGKCLSVSSPRTRVGVRLAQRWTEAAGIGWRRSMAVGEEEDEFGLLDDLYLETEDK